jgi:hypothetical protein
MGKKSKNPKASKTPTQPPVAAAAQQQPAGDYPSDGPSTEEVNSLQTSSRSLQAKLDALVAAAAANDRAGFVRQFVPLDLTQADADAYLRDLTESPEAEGQWTNLTSELQAIADGRNVHRIEGDQRTSAVFFFEHPLLAGCDREVKFVCSSDGEWRAEG